MEEIRPPRGLIVELVTPLDQHGSIDFSGLARHIKTLKTHVHGIFLASPRLGEGINLSPQSRKELLEAVLEVAGQEVSVFVWVSGSTEDQTRYTIELLEQVISGAGPKREVFWVDTPLYYHSNRGLPRLYSEFSSLSKVLFLLMNDPELTAQTKKPLKRKNIRTSIFKELSLFSNITGMIFLGPLDRAYNYQKAARGRAHFRIYDGDETRFLDYPSLSGVVSAGANLAPEQWRKVCDSSLQLNGSHKHYPDSLKQMWETGQFLYQLKEAYASAPSTLIRAALYEMGIFQYPPKNLTDNLHDLKERLLPLLNKTL